MELTAEAMCHDLYINKYFLFSVSVSGRVMWQKKLKIWFGFRDTEVCQSLGLLGQYNCISLWKSELYFYHVIYRRTSDLLKRDIWSTLCDSSSFTSHNFAGEGLLIVALIPLLLLPSLYHHRIISTHSISLCCKSEL